MSLDWCPGIREACAYWRDAPMLQQTFEALEHTLEQDNDACIDCAKTVVEVMCRVIVESFYTTNASLKPIQETPTISNWLSAAILALKLGDVRDNRFKKLVSSHHKLADALNELRNKAGPASDGKDPYLERLAGHHRRTAVLAADSIVAFLHQANLDISFAPLISCEPWERFERYNALIDAHVGLVVNLDNEDVPTLRVVLPDGEDIPLTIEVSRLLYLIDRGAYVEALNAARGVLASVEEPVTEQGEQ